MLKKEGKCVHEKDKITNSKELGIRYLNNYLSMFGHFRINILLKAGMAIRIRKSAISFADEGSCKENHKYKKYFFSKIVN